MDEKTVTIEIDVNNYANNKILLNDVDITSFVHRLSLDMVGSVRVPTLTLEIVAFRVKYKGNADVQAIFNKMGLDNG